MMRHAPVMGWRRDEGNQPGAALRSGRVWPTLPATRSRAIGKPSASTEWTIPSAHVMF
jgi:hypothetical protein